ncbi:leucine-rich repeat protein [Ruminococcus sp.]|uniref:leucine-rich repeat protein n=1 Tax=Ruminococcus sp. TaxID=41978 RepID=UPI00386648F0
MPPFAFKDCKNLKKVVCGKGLKKIYSWVFSGCDSFEELVKNEIVEVSEKAFDTKELNT